MKDLLLLERLSDAAKGTLIRAVWQRVQDLEQRLQDGDTVWHGRSRNPTGDPPTDSAIWEVVGYGDSAD
ncbi:hypothetical protein [Trichothermofontia sp.]